MTNREIALAFVGRFAASDVDGLRTLLDPGLSFRGPMLETNSADEYLTAVGGTDLERGDVQVIHVSEGSNAVAVFYNLMKPRGVLTVGQLFRFKAGRIAETVVVFDASRVA